MSFNCNHQDYVTFFIDVLVELMTMVTSKEADAVLLTLMGDKMCIRGLDDMPGRFSFLSNFTTNDNGIKAMADPEKMHNSTVRVGHNMTPEVLLEGIWMDLGSQGIEIRIKELQ